MFVKICGITNEQDALLSVALGADALGFIFAPSKRQVSPNLVRDIIKRLPREVMTIGVFVNESSDRVARIVHETGLYGAQLHGSEGPKTCRTVRSKINYLIKAVSIDGLSVTEYLRYPVDALLVDSEQPGSGAAFDWSLLDASHLGKNIILAGGLTPQNVGDAILSVKPYGVDVSTGVEVSPGRKDPVALRAFITNANLAFSRLAADRQQANLESERRPLAFNWEEDL